MFEIYVDGLLVIDKVQRGKPIGRISSRHTRLGILDCCNPDCMRKKASQMIDGLITRQPYLLETSVPGVFAVGV